MAAVFSVYSVVRPHEDLLQFLAERPQAKGLGEAVVVSLGEPFPADHDYRGQTADCATFTKLAYLAKLERDRRERSRAAGGRGAEAEALAELLGALPMTVATFDRWWSLERIGLAFEDLDQLLEMAPIDVLRTIEGPRERSTLAEQAARDYERHEVDLRSGSVDDVTGLARGAHEAQPKSRWPAPVGAWWDDRIARRSAGCGNR